MKLEFSHINCGKACQTPNVNVTYKASRLLRTAFIVPEVRCVYTMKVLPLILVDGKRI